MIVQNPLRCLACKTVTVLRIGVSNRPREPFRFTCQECNQEISGVFNTDQKRGKVLGLTDLLGAEEATSTEDVKFYHLYHPDFGTDSTGPALPGGLTLSPFLAALERQGPLELIARMQRVGKFRETIRSRGLDIIRTLQNYRTLNWSQFDKDVNSIISTSIVLGNATDRLCALSAVLNLAFEPLFDSSTHRARISAAGTLVKSLANADRSKFNTLLTELDNSYLTKVQNDLIDIITRFLRISEEFRGVLPDWDSENPDAVLPPHLQVTDGSRFHEVKSVYVDAYEAAARGLTIVVALINMRDRGDAHVFPRHPDLGSRFAPSDIADFHKQNNAPKLAYLRSDSLFNAWFLSALDPKLRNAIGHNTATYNPKTGLVSYAIDKRGTYQHVSYAQFLNRMLRLMLCCHEHLILIKMMLIYRQNPGEDVAIVSKRAVC